MAYKITAICDRCKKEETQNHRWFTMGDNKWKEIELKVSDYNKTEYLFCFDCQKELGLIDIKTARVQPAETVADRLMACIAEIVAGQVNT